MHVTGLVSELNGGGWRAVWGEMFHPQVEYDWAEVVSCTQGESGLGITLEHRGNRREVTILTTELQITATGSPPAHIALVEINRHRTRNCVIAGRVRTVLMHHVSLGLEHPERARAQPEAFTALIGKPLNSRTLQRIGKGFIEVNEGARLHQIDMSGDAVTFKFDGGVPITVALQIIDGRPTLALGGHEDKNLLSILARRA